MDSQSLHTAVQGYVRTATTSISISLFGLTLTKNQKTAYNSTRSVKDEKASEFIQPFLCICCVWHAVLLNSHMYVESWHLVDFYLPDIIILKATKKEIVSVLQNSSLAK